MKPKFFISPFFINKLHLYRAIREVTSKYKFMGKVLDIGCGIKPYKKFFKQAKKYDGIDLKSYSQNDVYEEDRPDFYFDKKYLETSKISFQDESYDHTVAFEVLEHHNNPNKLISEMYRITKKGGYMLLTVPFLGGIHEEPHDYQRYTKYGLQNLYKDYNCRIVDLKSIGSIFSTISLLLNEHLCNFVNKNKAHYFIGAVLYPPFLLFQYVSLILDLFFKSDHIVKGYLILVRKETS